MITMLEKIIVLMPVLIISITTIIILLSIAYKRNQCFHAVLAIFGLFLSIVFLGVAQNYRYVVHSMCQLVYIDNFSVLCAMLVLISSMLSGLLAYRWLLNHVKDRADEFYLLLLISSFGGILLTVTNHLAILFLGIELLSLPLFGLIGYSFFRKYSLEASIKYIILSGVSSSFLLLGMALIYTDTGHLLFTEINKLLLNSRTNWLYQQPVLVVGLSILMVGFGFKLSFVPFHLWTSDVYQGAPYPVSMYLATSSKVAVMSALIRFFLVFSDQNNEVFYIFLSSIACCSIFFGNLLAIQQDNIKRVLAYSSIAHTGYLLVSVIVLKKNPIVLEAVGIYLISYLIANVGIFSIIGIMSNEHCSTREDADLLYLYKGLFWKKPVLSVAFTIILLSLAGMPITLGFIGKFYLFMLGIDSELWCVVVFMSIGSIIGMFYYLKIMINLYLRPVGNICLHSAIVSNWTVTIEGMIVMIFTFLILFLGLYPQPIMHSIHVFLYR